MARAVRHVFIDPTGMLGEIGYSFVVVEAPTGIVYEQQYGGTACRQGEREGYLVPVAGGEAVRRLRHLFEVSMKGTGAQYEQLPDDVLEQVRSAVREVVFWKSTETGWGQEEGFFLEMDESRADEVDEAWVPVVTPDGPGVLTWPNSD